jgi:pimeloyl-ACP methyl ester carboxylesterase
MPFADVGAVRLFYTDEGAGDPAVLLVHGWSCDSHDWSWQIPAFAGKHRVIAVDNRGHGRSSVPVGGYTPRSFAADLAELLKTVNSGPVVAVGHSLGGIIVSVLAVEYPELVRAVVAVDPAYGGVDREGADTATRILAGLRGPSGHAVAAAAFVGMEAEATPSALLTWHSRRTLGMPIDVVVDTLAGILEGEDKLGFRQESERYLQRRQCPVLAVYRDRARADWDATTHRHPYSKRVAWDGSGHWLHQERPAEFNSLVLNWISGLPRSSTSASPW